MKDRIDRELENMSSSVKPSCPVNSYNEWDPLEEVIVGCVDGAMFGEWDIINKWTFPIEEWESIAKVVGKGEIPYPPEFVEAARKDLKEFIHILEAEGVTVRRVEPIDFSAPYATPAWQTACGFCAANPRDVCLVIGNEIIEVPMADRTRYFESWPYRPLLKEYFQAGAKWTAAPKPQLLDAQYDMNFQFAKPGEELRFVVTEFEPTFDAADFVRCGRDIFGQKSHVTNSLGIEWLQRHLGAEYRIHILESLSPYTIHIDTTFMPLAPGKVLVNPEFIDINKLPKILKSWDILVPPEPVPYSGKLKMMSNWIQMNILMLDEERVIVEKSQEALIKALKDWGFKPIPCSFENYYPFLGSFHCATLDVRRRGELQSYFD
ncbi:MAG: amidinotransferase [Oscillatoriaceae cyanobacterium Prado104]|nr:amidinotransferase [Oscillatoriaceae cyanobacterium Prado104]